jgi:hypothetical protein
MAYGQKYELQFKSHKDNELCKVQFFFDGYTGDITQLDGAAKPFSLREFNTEEDIFKPIRPQVAEIQFYSTDTVSIDDFLSNSDTYCYIHFYFGGSIYWKGYLTQDDFQESWQDTRHVITLRATEGLGFLKTIPLSDNIGNELRGKFSVQEILTYAANSDVISYLQYYIVNNLFCTGMNDTTGSIGALNPLSQAYIDARTFATSDGIYEDKYTVIEKINKSYNQTIFQYQGHWYIIRMEELFIPSSENLTMYDIYALRFPDSNITYDIKYNIAVGINESVKPIMPEMLRFLKRPTKRDKINQYYDYPDEVFTNQSFSRGTLIDSTSSYKTYSIDNWYAYTTSKDSPVATTVNYYRKDVINTTNSIIDSYIWMDRESPLTTIGNWWQSESIPAVVNDIFDISFNWRKKDNITSVITGNTNRRYCIAQIFFTDTRGHIWYLKNTGDWKLLEPPYLKDSVNSNPSAYIQVQITDDTLLENKWTQVSILTKPVPGYGTIEILFTRSPVNGSTPTPDPYAWNYDGIYSQLKVKYQPAVESLPTLNINGQYVQFDKTEDIKADFEDEIYINDSGNKNISGSLFRDDLTTLTTPTWYRRRFPLESESFQKQNLIAHWQQNRIYRNKIDVTFYGLRDALSNPLGLLHTVTFTDDDPNKVYAIVNIKDIDFSSSIWTATLMEVHDANRDIIGSYAELTPGSHFTTGTNKFPLTFTSNSKFQLISGNTIRYIDTVSAAYSISAKFTGTITVSAPPQNITISLRTNLHLIASEIFTVSTSPMDLNINLYSITDRTLVTNEEVYLEIVGFVYSVNVTSGSLIINSLPNFTKDYIRQ